MTNTALRPKLKRNHLFGVNKTWIPPYLIYCDDSTLDSAKSFQWAGISIWNLMSHYALSGHIMNILLCLCLHANILVFQVPSNTKT